MANVAIILGGGAIKIEMKWHLADDALAIENHSKKKKIVAIS